MNKFYKSGFTIIEILVTIATVAVIVAIVMPQFSKIRERQALKSSARDVLSLINKARSETLASYNSSEYGIHFQSNQAILFTGKVFSAVAPDNQIVDITSPVGISNVTLGGVSGASGDLYFKRLSGVPNVSGTVTMSAPSSSVTIIISSAGLPSLLEWDPTLVVSPTTISAGGTVSVTWTNILNPTSHYWIGLYSTGPVSDYGYISYVYQGSCTNVVGSAPSVFGSCDFVIPSGSAPLTTYQFRLFEDIPPANGLMRTASFTVTAP